MGALQTIIDQRNRWVFLQWVLWLHPVTGDLDKSSCPAFAHLQSKSRHAVANSDESSEAVSRPKVTIFVH